nr:hypothetical protein [Tanacetum cinerariifolium]
FGAVAQQLANLLARFQGRLPAALGLGTRAEAFGQVDANLELIGHVGAFQRLLVGVADNKLHILDALLVHVLHGIGAPTAHPNHLDDGAALSRGCRHRRSREARDNRRGHRGRSCRRGLVAVAAYLLFGVAGASVAALVLGLVAGQHEAHAGGVHRRFHGFNLALAQVLVGVTDARIEASEVLGQLLQVLKLRAATREHDAGRE